MEMFDFLQMSNHLYQMIHVMNIFSYSVDETVSSLCGVFPSASFTCLLSVLKVLARSSLPILIPWQVSLEVSR